MPGLIVLLFPASAVAILAPLQSVPFIPNSPPVHVKNKPSSLCPFICDILGRTRMKPTDAEGGSPVSNSDGSVRGNLGSRAGQVVAQHGRDDEEQADSGNTDPGELDRSEW